MKLFSFIFSCVLLWGCGHTKVDIETKLVPAQLLSIEDDRFNESAALVGFMLGGGLDSNSSAGSGVLYGGGAGVLFANGCHLTLRVEEPEDTRTLQLEIGRTLECRELQHASAKQVTVERRITTYRWEDGRVQNTVHYSWPSPSPRPR